MRRSGKGGVTSTAQLHGERHCGTFSVVAILTTEIRSVVAMASWCHHDHGVGRVAAHLWSGFYAFCGNLGIDFYNGETRDLSGSEKTSPDWDLGSQRNGPSACLAATSDGIYHLLLGLFCMEIWRRVSYDRNHHLRIRALLIRQKGSVFEGTARNAH